MVQDHELVFLLQLCQNRGVDTRPSHHDVSEQILRSWSWNGTVMVEQKSSQLMMVCVQLPLP